MGTKWEFPLSRQEARILTFPTFSPPTKSCSSAPAGQKCGHLIINPDFEPENATFESHYIAGVCTYSRVSSPISARAEESLAFSTLKTQYSIVIRQSIVACQQKTQKWDFFVTKCHHQTYHSSKELKSGNSHSVPGKCHTLGVGKAEGFASE